MFNCCVGISKITGYGHILQFSAFLQLFDFRELPWLHWFICKKSYPTGWNIFLVLRKRYTIILDLEHYSYVSLFVSPRWHLFLRFIFLWTFCFWNICLFSSEFHTIVLTLLKKNLNSKNRIKFSKTTPNKKEKKSFVF